MYKDEVSKYLEENKVKAQGFKETFCLKSWRKIKMKKKQ